MVNMIENFDVHTLDLLYLALLGSRDRIREKDPLMFKVKMRCYVVFKLIVH